jgi:ribonucleotide reductase beta subunit family protein with ferritin-like domain
MESEWLLLHQQSSSNRARSMAVAEPLSVHEAHDNKHASSETVCNNACTSTSLQCIVALVHCHSYQVMHGTKLVDSDRKARLEAEREQLRSDDREAKASMQEFDERIRNIQSKMKALNANKVCESVYR